MGVSYMKVLAVSFKRAYKLLAESHYKLKMYQMKLEILAQYLNSRMCVLGLLGVFVITCLKNDI